MTYDEESRGQGKQDAIPGILLQSNPRPPSLKPTLKPLLSARGAPKKYGAVEASSLPSVSVKKTDGKKPTKK